MRKIVYVVSFLLIIITAISCGNIKNKKTTLEVVDNNRHFYPIQSGQELDIVFQLKNTGKDPFILEDIITSCGCLVMRKSSFKTIPAGKEGFLILDYNSTKNVGVVRHYILLYGNFANTDKIEINFDVHVVPNALYTKDYEELYQEEKEKGRSLKSLVDGNENHKGYYMDDDL